MKSKLGVVDSREAEWKGAEEQLSGDVSISQPVVHKGSKETLADDNVGDCNPSECASKSHYSGGTVAATMVGRQRRSTASSSKGSILRKLSFTAATSMGSDQYSEFSSSSGSNIWSKLMNQNESLWDNVDGSGAFDDDDESICDDDGKQISCQKSLKRCGLTWWWETRHFFSTMFQHPHILLTSLLTFGILCGAGLAAITAERDNYIEKQKSTAEFVVSLLKSKSWAL